ncbi:MAG: hypothetical protein RR555_08190 [Bacteroidales bacterium]
MKQSILIKVAVFLLMTAACLLFCCSLQANTDRYCPEGMEYDPVTEMCYPGGSGGYIVCRCSRDISTKPDGCFANAGGKECASGDNIKCWEWNNNCG